MPLFTIPPKPIVLLILDGWGIGPNTAGNAILRANTPHIDQYTMQYPHTQLSASGKSVGLPQGEDGNTETGHLNIGAGRIVYQELPRINMAIADGSFNKNQEFAQAFQHIRDHNSVLHLMGLIGSGGVHSNIEHLYALLNLAKISGLTNNVYLHLFTDGRDSPPTSGLFYIREIQEKCKELGTGKIASIMGRYYAMDRDHRWDRTEIAYNALTTGSEEMCVTDPTSLIQQYYDQGITDEFIKPLSICEPDGTKRVVSDNDAVIFFNYRIDRPRQLTKAFVLPDFEQGIGKEEFDPYSIKYERSHIHHSDGGSTFTRRRQVQNLFFVTMTRYEVDLPVHVAFPPLLIQNPLGKILANHGIKQLRMAETEKERFVTYYMNGQRDEVYENEDRIIVPSQKVATYDLAPEMSARELTAKMIEEIGKNKYEVIIANIANADMVAHTGNLQASITACQIVDECVGQIVNSVLPKGGVVMITADHGNAEEVINNQTGEVDTEHSIYPVPLLIITPAFANRPIALPNGILGDIAPTILALLDIPKPEEMSGRNLLATLTM